MINRYGKTVRKLLGRMHIYRHVHIAYWNKKFAEDKQRGTALKQARQKRKRSQEQQLMKEYQALALEMVQHYKMDAERHRASIRLDYLLVNFTQSLRQELNAEALSLSATRMKGSPGQAFKDEISAIIDKAVVTLQQSLLHQCNPIHC